MPLVVERELSARNVVASLCVGEERLGAPRDPLHRPLQPARRPDDERLLRVMLALVAEAAAHVARDDAQSAFVDAELLAYIAPDVVRRLRAAVKRVAGGDGAARLDRRAAQAIVRELEQHATRRARKGGVDGGAVAALP